MNNSWTSPSPVDGIDFVTFRFAWNASVSVHRNSGRREDVFVEGLQPVEVIVVLFLARSPREVDVAHLLEHFQTRLIRWYYLMFRWKSLEMEAWRRRPCVIVWLNWMWYQRLIKWHACRCLLVYFPLVELMIWATGNSDDGWLWRMEKRCQPARLRHRIFPILHRRWIITRNVVSPLWFVRPRHCIMHCNVNQYWISIDGRPADWFRAATTDTDTIGFISTRIDSPLQVWWADISRTWDRECTTRPGR